MNDIVPDTIKKALSGILNPLKYGTVAEIGAGRWAGLYCRPERWPGIPSPPHTIEFGSQTEKTIWQ